MAYVLVWGIIIVRILCFNHIVLIFNATRNYRHKTIWKKFRFIFFNLHAIVKKINN